MQIKCSDLADVGHISSPGSGCKASLTQTAWTEREEGHGTPKLIQGQFITGKRKRYGVGKKYQRTSMKTYQGINVSISKWDWLLPQKPQPSPPCTVIVAGVPESSAGWELLRAENTPYWSLNAPQYVSHSRFFIAVPVDKISWCTYCVSGTVTLMSVHVAAISHNWFLYDSLLAVEELWDDANGSLNLHL